VKDTADTFRYSVKTATAIFGAGCFWGTEAYFRELPGVVSTEVGYSGGKTKNPTYEEVCSGTTGHAESLKIVFDPSAISYETLVRHFFRMHDPTQRDRQGNDIGSQYRSVAFYDGPEQKRIVEEIIVALTKAGKYRKPIVTQVVPASPFYSAEAYHQDYLEKNPGGYCHVDLDLLKVPLD
jgi:peptide methionine sulfoxide reductase msrA/msrB